MNENSDNQRVIYILADSVAEIQSKLDAKIGNRVEASNDEYVDSIQSIAVVANNHGGFSCIAVVNTSSAE